MITIRADVKNQGIELGYFRRFKHLVFISVVVMLMTKRSD